MKSHIENALACCGRDRVLHRDGAEASIAIRWDQPAGPTSPDGTSKFLVRNAPTLDEAGELAARAFAARLRERAAELVNWASHIELALKRGGSR